MNELVSIIIVNFNGERWLKGCLRTLEAQTYKLLEIIVVDNASSDGSKEFIQENHPDIIFIENRRNEGFAGGNNIGFERATGEFILFLNNDTEVTKDFLAELVNKFDSDEKIGVLQSKILLLDDGKRLDVVGDFLTNTGFLYHYAFGAKDVPKYDKITRLYSAKGACMMARKQLLDKLKIDNEIFDGRYFAYFEETDLCHRVWMAGYKVEYCSGAIIYHKMGATSSSLDNAFVQYHSFKNRINSYLKNLEYKELFTILLINILMSYLGSLVYLFQLNFKLFWAINKAVLWNLKELPTTLGKRNYIHKVVKKKKFSEFKSEIMFNPPSNYYFYLFTDLSKYDFQKDELI